MKYLIITCLKLSLIINLSICAFSTMAQSLDITSLTTEIDLSKHIKWTVAQDDIQLSGVQNIKDWQQNLNPASLQENQNLWGE
ncbi:hypothetical protein RS130_02210 [Paraglaciecola aquimarina]|uniref:Uncharacterized protein n=1 Tax=Paraglaciecola aquimarina TaxID=1235557 RepID=A0ABU3SSA2_9ALTE|nr:hypothetical protein [Paraglaciecola aquimarina]MDU0352891.1 hypothetical protein [Paraglaciecola aquimarina]